MAGGVFAFELESNKRCVLPGSLGGFFPRNEILHITLGTIISLCRLRNRRTSHATAYSHNKLYVEIRVEGILSCTRDLSYGTKMPRNTGFEHTRAIG